MSGDVITLPETSTTSGTGTPLLRHIVELDAQGNPTDKCLCGHLWDRVFLKQDPDAGICQECVDELRRRKQG